MSKINNKKPCQGRGLTLFFTGLSGAGKSTLSERLNERLVAEGERTVTLLDGDVVREHLTTELGFSREDRNRNVTRVGYVASEITRHGGIALCAMIAPYREARQQVREMVEAHGQFVEIHVMTSLEECERRDVKGLYARARAGEIAEFTGISDPYEAPENPEIAIDTSDITPDEGVEMILTTLNNKGYLSSL